MPRLNWMFSPVLAIAALISAVSASDNSSAVTVSAGCSSAQFARAWARFLN